LCFPAVVKRNDRYEKPEHDRFHVENDYIIDRYRFRDHLGEDPCTHLENDAAENKTAEKDDYRKKRRKDSYAYDETDDPRQKKIDYRVYPERLKRIDLAVDLHDGDLRIDGGRTSQSEQDNCDKRRKLKNDNAHDDVSQILDKTETFDSLKNDPDKDAAEDRAEDDKKVKQLIRREKYLHDKDIERGTVEKRPLQEFAQTFQAEYAETRNIIESAHRLSTKLFNEVPHGIPRKSTFDYILLLSKIN
jgi:hypothetical protein